MNIVIAENLLNQMNEANADHTYYRGQKVSRIYLRRILWKANCYEDHRKANKSAGRVLTMEGVV